MVFDKAQLDKFIDENLPDDLPEKFVKELLVKDLSFSGKLLEIIKYKNPSTEISSEWIEEHIGRRQLIKWLNFYSGLDLVP